MIKASLIVITTAFLLAGAVMLAPGFNPEVQFNKGPLERTNAMPDKNHLKGSGMENNEIQLPQPRYESNVPVEQAMRERRSRRTFTEQALTLREVSQILWAAYGITQPQDDPAFLRGGFKTAPSAGALYPLEVYLVAGNVEELTPGVYKYIPTGHKIKRVVKNDMRQALSAAALSQEMIGDAPAGLVYTAVFRRTTTKYGERGRKRYVPMEVGFSAENVYLQAEALGLGTCMVGAFEDEAVSDVLQLPPDEEPLVILPLGHPSSSR